MPRWRWIMSKRVVADDSDSASWLHYVLAFSSFALIALALMSGKIQSRQTAIEQQFHGIQQMQRADAAASEEPLKTPGQTPTIITLQPLMMILGGVLAVAWLALLLRRFRRRLPPGDER